MTVHVIIDLYRDLYRHVNKQDAILNLEVSLYLFHVLLFVNMPLIHRSCAQTLTHN